MKEKISTLIKSKWVFLRKNWKWSILGLVILLIIISKIVPNGFNPKTEIVEIAKIQNLQKTVKATGNVTSSVNLELSFNNSGVVSNVNTFLGQYVYKGQVLASLNAGSELGALNQAYGALKSAQAALARTLEGNTSEEVRVAEVTLENAKRAYSSTEKLQNTLVKNARANLYSNSLLAVSNMASSNTTAPTISGTYTADIEDEYNINIYSTGSGQYASYSSLTGQGGSFPVSTNTPIALGDKGLYIQFSTSSTTYNESWKIKIPNTTSVNYNTNLSSLKSAEDTRFSALETAQATIDNAQANLDLKKAKARPSDVLAREADVLTAQGRVQSALGAYEEKIIRAPINGYITRQDLRIGENIESKKIAIVLEERGGLFLEANINEADIDLIKPGQVVSFTVDTLGNNQTFIAEVTHIDGSPTKDGNIVNYKIKANILTGQDQIKIGSTANLSILIQEKENIVVIPNRAIYTNEDGTKYILFVTNEKKAKTKKLPVTVGFTGDGAMTEITSGLTGSEMVLFKTK
ncbi:hypothetical protein A3C57_00450 [Candidatus Nomurabacteria bacterium RIFCSPHIGHO2_02_FULL_33_12]|uniref:LcnD-like C-terminal domain-containing protein n=1 Tax=Candidatus Nomurabacteria bacterium RIFCSPLOWO2_01_FULL_33_17 TaxID=1801764 RepID=A0A1F6WR32_9BACT|nr:MAG: hypothetical protein A3C57_00450 [Candidatus Nomurabacteria bacterium RIFCSPHIGHO2_02_FULL_33_12]OGI84274.1 MAG: hypothetical protein A2903_00150 [Candidatus Nomurabacteria bacterium RIFCSPLOWO2_01_FULL_33_17]